MGLVFSSLLDVLCYPGLIRRVINHRCGKSLREGGGRRVEEGRVEEGRVEEGRVEEGGGGGY